MTHEVYGVYLKSFEIQGFKSFPDKTALVFGDGVTAVVGPNGSGKSNIADAARWVLGEQSPRALRCEKRMEEIIFHGTEHRGPVGFAEVSLLLDNSGGLFPMEQHEVLVTRRLYRSGESEYYINRASVRLKDVLDLFMDTGLGRDGYSLIGQGRIGEILSEKSGDRRRVFEEASGISRYRHRKEESERKLQLAEENLTRIGDKIEELELQVGPLREQAEKARRYLHMRDELRGLEIALWLDQLDKLRDGFGKVHDDYHAVSEQLSAGQAAVEALYAELEELSEAERDNHRQAEQLRAEHAALAAAAGELESAMAVLRNTMAHNEENMARIRAEQEQGRGRDGGLAAQMEERRAHMGALDAELAATEAELAALLSEAERLSERAGGAAARAEGLRAREAAAREAAGDARAALSSLVAAAGEMGERRQALTADLAAREQGCEAAAAALAELDARIAEAEETLSSLQNVINGYELRRDSRRKKAEGLKAEHAGALAERDRLQSRLQMLSDMEKEYEGHSRAVKTVLGEHGRGSLSGVHGAVSELVRVDDRYAVAVETALGPALQNIVVDREEDAKAAIELLRRRDAGRATFLPLSTVTGRALDEPDLDREPGFVGVASELVRHDAAYDGILRSLLGRTVVVETMDAAIALARRRRQRLRIVTLTGQVIAPGGAMTGGSAGRNVGVLSRRNEMDRLTETLAKGEESLAELFRALTEAERELMAVSYDCDVAFAERRTAEDEALALRSERTHKDMWAEGVRTERDRVRAELATVMERLEAGAGEAARLEAAVAEENASAEALAAEIAVLMAGQSDLQGEGAKLSEGVAALRARLAALSAERTADEKALGEYEQLRRELMGDQAQKEAAVTSYTQKNGELLAELGVKQEEALRLSEQAEEKNAALEALYGARQALEGRRVRCDRGAKEQNEENLKLERERSRLEARKASAEAEEKSIMDRLWDNYGLTHSAALALKAPVASLSKAGRRAGELRSAITALGSPNIGAIEEYDRVYSRYEYLTAQRDDAAAAKADLLALIEELTGEMKGIFETKFALIAEKFTQTFKEIFGGGDARLELEDPEDVLYCGVEIRAQPPGKKMRSISLLSGGEKSLVAIALYFAIFRVRPAPFCILDEVDHDLDDVNVARFAAYLRRLAEEIQFVVVTHRRGTMEMADMLYGVTTQEEGVSKILSLKLQDAEQALGVKLG